MCKNLRELIDKIKECDDMNGIINNVGHLYPKLSSVYNYIFTFSITTATSERSFNKMKLIKNYLRTTLSNEKLEYLLLCAVQRDLLDKVNLSKVADEWVTSIFIHKLLI